MVHLWTQQETGKPPLTWSRFTPVHILCIPWSRLHLSAFLRWSPQKQSPGPVPATVCPGERRHGLVVRLQVHKQPTLLWWHAQAGLHCIRPATWTNQLFLSTSERSLNWTLMLLLHPHFCKSAHWMKAENVNWSWMASVWFLCLVNISLCLAEKERSLFLSYLGEMLQYWNTTRGVNGGDFTILPGVSKISLVLGGHCGQCCKDINSTGSWM